MSDDRAPLEVWAHSPSQEGGRPDPYARHVEAVRRGASERARSMLIHAMLPNETKRALLDSIETAARFHDLGKLDDEIQAILKKFGRDKLKWDHIDAGVAHLTAKANQNWMAAWLVRAHHAPGLPPKAVHFNDDATLARRLRGRRWDEMPRGEHAAQKNHTDKWLSYYLDIDRAVLGAGHIIRQRPLHGLKMRLALSCLVDADHTDSAFAQTGQILPPPPEPRWGERLEHLCDYVKRLDKGSTAAERSRTRLRDAFFEACLNSDIRAPMVACEGTVGLGKTTAVTAYLLRRAKEENLRRLFIIAPYTNILQQTADRLRKALTLPGENPNAVLIEHHHRADFSCKDERSLAVLWRAPIVLTTAVGFFETLAANNPASLRKLHEVVGSAIFFDEAHASLPAKLWRQNWEWLRELAKEWCCRFVFASGSLARIWENKNIVESIEKLPLLAAATAPATLAAENLRVRYVRTTDGNLLKLDELVELVERSLGPRLIIFNTVQNAAVFARVLRDEGKNVLHLSTALTPNDRKKVIKKVEEKLHAQGPNDWTLVATSCVEAGVDFSFRTAFRERFSVASLIQVGGRVNRHGEYTDEGGSLVYDFALSPDAMWSSHPDAKNSASILGEYIESNKFCLPPSDIVSEAMAEEIKRLAQDPGKNELRQAELAKDYPNVKKAGQVICQDTRVVVIEPQLIAALKQHAQVNFQALINGSVQIWAKKIDQLALKPIHPDGDLYEWPECDYDAEFLGYMDGILSLKDQHIF